MIARIVFCISGVALLAYSAITKKCPASGRSESSIFGWMFRGHAKDSRLAQLPFTHVFKCREDNRCQSSPASLTTGQNKPGQRTSFQTQRDVNLEPFVSLINEGFWLFE